MKKILVAILLFLTLFTSLAQNQIDIIPVPQKVEMHTGYFILNPKTKIISDPSLKEVAEMLSEELNSATGSHVKVQIGTTKKAKNSFFFELNSDLGNEAYILNSDASGVKISAKNAAGAFYGLQSLLQLLPPEIYGENQVNTPLTVPFCKIEDAPRYAYRGMHLDVARHFSPVSFVKKYINLLALHKFNTFHWHLTDDQGWRIEIKKYPELTQISAFRKETLIGRDRKNPRYDGTRYGGFYTQEEINEVIEYAAKRYITIIPEIEMPGHAQAVLAAFPQLACNQDKIYEVMTTWGISPDVFAPREETFTFLENVLSEVIDLFPGKYIHIGGDECLKYQWKTSHFCQNLMKKEGLKDENELQSYFIRRIEEFVNSKGRSIIGWDEILEGGISPTATIMSWRGEQGGIAAAKENHDVIMTPDQYVYLDYYQSGVKADTMAVGKFLPLEKVYGYDPAPKELTAEQQKKIIGFQGNVWTEQMATTARIEYMVFPRACAIAETAWSDPDRKNFEDFEKRLNQHLKRLDELHVNYFKK